CHQVCPTRIESSCLNENNVCFNATNPFETYTLSLHDALPISITYRLRIRPVGSPTWLATLGPFTRSIKSVSPLLRTHLEWRHVQVAHVFSNLAPAQYEVEIEITGKSIAEQRGRNRADACFLL